MGLIHIRRGCLARKIQDIRSDGSRIEGSHKGWSGIHRSFALGLELAEAFGHDHVLRRNLRIAHKNKRSSPFITSTYGSHHTRLVNSTNNQWNAQVKRDRRDTGQNRLSYRPTLPVVNSGERFGLVNPADAESFGHMLETIKEEEDGEEDTKGDQLLLHSEMDPHELMKELHIDPALLDIPQHHAGSTNVPSVPSGSAAVITSTDPSASATTALIDLSNEPTGDMMSSRAQSPSITIIEHAHERMPISKRKSSHIESPGSEPLTPETGSKRPRLGAGAKQLSAVSELLRRRSRLQAHVHPPLSIAACAERPAGLETIFNVYTYPLKSRHTAKQVCCYQQVGASASETRG